MNQFVVIETRPKKSGNGWKRDEVDEYNNVDELVEYLRDVVDTSSPDDPETHLVHEQKEDGENEVVKYRETDAASFVEAYDAGRYGDAFEHVGGVAVWYSE